MSFESVTSSILAAIAAVLAVGCFELWRRSRAAFSRIFRLERRVEDQDRRLAILSRLACTTRALSVPNPNGEAVLCRSQHGEELLIWELLDWQRDGFFIEIGAYDGVSLSNSEFFERIGWKGILVEAHPDLAARCRQNRPGSDVVHAALGDGTRGDRILFSTVKGRAGMDTLSFSDATPAHSDRVIRRGGQIDLAEVPYTTLDAILSSRRALPRIDWISIDVEGAEMQVLKGANLRKHRPRVMVVEDNTGDSDTTVTAFLAEEGYRRVLRCGCNNVYELSA